MQPRERVLTAMRHEEPDRVPLFYRDVPEIEERMRRQLGIPDREALLRFFDVDFRWVEPLYVGPPLLDPAMGRVRDIWGVEYRYVIAGHGGYWEPVVFPLAEVDEPAALERYPWPQVEWFDFDVLDTQFDAYAGYAIMTAPGYTSPGVLATIQSLLGMERALTDMLLRPAFYQALIDHIVAFNVAFVTKLYEHAGDRIDFFRIGDDFGTQEGLLVGPRQFRGFFQPALMAISQIAKEHGSYYYHHCCGSVCDLIPLLLETGVDVLDPIQVRARGMDPAGLKAAWGGRLCFSGGVDEQELLPRGTPADVRQGVSDLLDAIAPGGGFFLGPTHNLQTDIPTANVVAMYEAGRAWRYS